MPARETGPPPGRARGGAFVLFATLVLALVEADAGQVYPDTPSQIDPKGHYLIFLQGPVAPVLVVLTRRLLGRKPFADPEPASAAKLVDTGAAGPSPATAKV